MNGAMRRLKHGKIKLLLCCAAWLPACTNPFTTREPEPVVGGAGLAGRGGRQERGEVPSRAREARIAILRELVADHGCDERNALLTDRSFLVKAVKILRAQALLAGRDRVELADLGALRWMTTFRVPEEVHARVPELLRRHGAAS